ncbi:type IV toxin-antitoxin system AbiEi family antitoxin domain-containing protein [Saccharothrix longispora]|uniref:Transcriptional regulator of viral defense system n=1 Tax=Saccharothrix longispora TaxID=33920 RepID=A0ABU1PZM1_9PSEU|nr:type IV toxin-antitoxin system AbiEi family antitoxin domain-containing protein [Saccharothrix longispora]MDR6596097.1 putative transcriptional regulator of viral defense system [Saccharothrix longispora]MDU0290631.1 type IV toxin-antitoxin system AbiEi family antitoxin domain-containing protein [Saccharothrix longispora]
MEMVRALELLGGYTAGQWGMVTTRQALAVGVGDVTLHRLRGAGLLETVRRGVHATTSSAASDARLEQAAWLALRPDTAGWERPALDPDGGVVSHRSAARLHGLGDLPDSGVEITVPRRRTTRDPGVRLHRAELRQDDVALLDGLPITTPVRTICDLLGRHVDASHIATIIRQSVKAGQVDLADLVERIGPHARRYGVARGNGVELLAQLLAQIGVSPGELAIVSPRLTWKGLSESTWGQLAKTEVTWGDLATASPEFLQRLLRAAPDRDATTDQDDRS